MYDRCVESLMRTLAKGESARCNVMVASHNEDSVRRATALMAELEIDPRSGAPRARRRRPWLKGAPCAGGVYFGQLLGMADHLTFTLGMAKHRAYKYVPYGQVATVVPYLLRRAQENSTLFGSPGVQKERRMIEQELRARLGLSAKR
jgi:hypothetical protein